MTPPKTQPPVDPAKPDVEDDATIFGSVQIPVGRRDPLAGSDYPDKTIAPQLEPETTGTFGGSEPSKQQSPPRQVTPTGGARTLDPGTVINNMYRVDGALGEGGMGRVFRGVEIGTGDPVAIKVILPEMAEEQKVADMFKREARTLRQLHHPAIVRYFAYVPPDAQLDLHALIMGFIEGTKLSDRIRERGAVSVPQACHLFIRLADGLAAAHEKGVVHRDLSPDNVMLPDGDIKKAVLIDFGISRSSKVKDVTLGNEFAGKLKYVSPEQLGAFGGEADARSDIYSMGLLMIMALTGQAASMGDTIVEAVRKRDVVPDLSGVPAEFQTLLFQMLQPDPMLRMPNMTLVKAAIEAIAAGDDPVAPVAEVSQAPRQVTTPSRPVEGLQVAPSVGGIEVTAFGSENARTIAPLRRTVTQAPEETEPSFEDAPKRRRTGTWVLSILAVLAIGGGVAWSQLGTERLMALVQPKPVETQPETPTAPGLTRVEGTQATFLANAVPEVCAFATLREKGDNAGAIQAFRGPDASLGDIASAWAAEYGAAPSVMDQRVEATQCPALDMARAFQGTAAAPMELVLETPQASPQDGIFGSVYGSAGRADWLGIVAPNGRVYSLAKQFADPIGEERRFSFRLPSAEPGIYVLLALASEAALVRAGAIQDGTPAPQILELIQRELSQDAQGAVDIAVVEITP